MITYFYHINWTNNVDYRFLAEDCEKGKNNIHRDDNDNKKIE